MIREGFDFLATSGWTIVPPSALLVITILAISLVGDSLRDAAGRQTGGRR